MVNVFFEIHNGLSREGPGDNQSTRRAYRMLTDLPTNPRILDVGCGPGMQTIELAKVSNGKITALDNHQPFLDALKKHVMSEGVSENIKIINGDMNSLGFEAKSFDLIWSEGAIYNIGFEKGLYEWRKFLVDKGYLAVSELCWLNPNPPNEVKTFFSTGYPSMKRFDENLQTIKAAGYRVVGYFVLPESSWWKDYYTPISAKLPALKAKYNGDEEALTVIRCEELEIELFSKYSRHYGYVFYLMQAE
jgi:ubiquinone/menaquinone biosynthesis C-methylase UbiE